MGDQFAPGRAPGLVIFGQTGVRFPPPEAQALHGSIHPRDGELLPARYYLRLVELLVEQGLDRAELAQVCSWSGQAARDPLAGIGIDQVELLCALAHARCGASELGLRLGLALDPEAHDVLGLAMLHARSVEQALQLAARYFFLLSPGFRMRYLPDTHGGRIEVAPWLAFSGPALALHLDAVLGALHRELAQISELGMPATEVQVSWNRPVYAASYRRLRGWRLQFAACQPAGFRLRLPADWLRSPRRRADPGQLADAEARCAARMHSVRRAGRVADWARMLLREADAALAQDELARLSGLSVRSFHRHLQREGSSFRLLQNAARMQAALQRLRQGQTATAVAAQLGYANSANFSRAFRRAFGTSPSLHERMDVPRCPSTPSSGPAAE